MHKNSKKKVPAKKPPLSKESGIGTRENPVNLECVDTPSSVPVC